MPQNPDREKLINAILYFANHTQKLGKTKLFKLLYLLDFDHYKAIGRSVTGLTYNAWKQGPVPVDLNNEIENVEKQPDMAEKITFEKQRSGFYKPVTKAYFDKNVFSRRELEILKNLAEEFEMADSDEMILRTHLPNEPWDRVWNQENRKQGVIPYEYGVSDEDKEFIELIRRENEEFEKFGN